MTRRLDRVNVLLRHEISRIVTVELRDPRLSAVVSIIQVDTSADLRHAKVFVSVLGDQVDKQATIDALKSASGFIHRTLRQQVSLKTVPYLSFQLDESIERGSRILELMRDVKSPPGAVEEA